MMDDGIGIHIVEELQKTNSNTDIQYVVGETDVYYCLNQIENALMTIIIDAAYLNKEPGSISIVPIAQVFDNPVYQISVHDMNFLDWVKKSGQHVKGLLIGIEPYEIDFGTSLSPILEAHFTGLCDGVRDVIEDCVQNKKASVE